MRGAITGRMSVRTRTTSPASVSQSRVCRFRQWPVVPLLLSFCIVVPRAGLEKNVALADASPRGSPATSVPSHCAEVMRASGATQDRSMHTHTMRDSMQSAPVLGRGRQDTGRLAEILDFQSRFGVPSKKKLAIRQRKTLFPASKSRNPRQNTRPSAVGSDDPIGAVIQALCHVLG